MMKKIYSSLAITILPLAISVRSMLALTIVTLIIFAAAAAPVQAQISITSLNTPIMQNFDGMGTGNLLLTDEITGSLPGFHALREFGNANPNFVSADDGSGTAGGFMNYGPSLQLDRALGMLPDPSTGGMRLGLRLINNSGVAINSFDVSFVGEQWRNGGNQTPHSMIFAYRTAVNVNDLFTGVYTPVPALAFTSPQTGPIAGPLDGNAAANRTVITASFAVSVPAGHEIMLRWEDLDAFGDDHGLSIDDLVVTPRGASTAAPASISGRVVDHNGRGLSRVRIILTGGNLTEPLTALTNTFGYYRFENVETGEFYTLRVGSKIHRFDDPVRSINLLDNFTGVDFVASP